MIATQILVEEHRIILSVLNALEKWVLQLERGGVLDANLAKDFVSFFREFADETHHSKEEIRLFKDMQKENLVPDAIGSLTEDHGTSRKLVQAMERTSRQMNVEHFCESGREFVEMLRRHIQLEDDAVFPVADSMGQEMSDEFDKIEREAGGKRHVSALELANSLCERVGVECVTKANLPTLSERYLHE